MPISEPSDPFTERLMALPAAPLAQPIPPVTRDEMMPPVVPALHSQPIGMPDNRVEQASAGLSLPATQELPQQVAMSPGPLLGTAPTAAGATNNDQKLRAEKLMREARQALAAGDLQQAEESARLASATGVPESSFLPNEDRPSLLAWDIQRARANGTTALPAANSAAASNDRYATQARMSPEVNSAPAYQTTSLPSTTPDLRFAQLPEPLNLPPDGAGSAAERLPSPMPSTLPSTQQSFAPSPPAAPSGALTAQQPVPFAAGADNAEQLVRAGEAALKRQDRQQAAKLFGQAYVLRDELNPTEQVRLQGYLSQLADAVPPAAPISSARPASPNLIESAVEDQQTQARQMSAEVGKKQSEARRMRESKPQEALKLLQDTRQQVANSKLSEEYRTQLLRRIDITLDETEKYIKDHHAEIELDQQNQAVLEQVDRSREVRIKVQQKVAELVDEFNKLADEQRYAEMEVVARRLFELAPEEPVAQQVWQNAKFIRRNIMNQRLADDRESSNWNALNDVETSAIQKVGDGHELVYDEKQWNALVKNRKSGERETRRTERELEIERRLKTPVLLRYEDTPLSEVVDGLSNLAGVNIHLDPRGLSQEGVESSTPVTINLSKEISLKSALNLILEPLHLSYVIKDEVLKITSEQLRDGETYVHTYNVADLVIPIPNFVPNNNIGLQGLINDAHATIGYGGGGIGMPGPTVLVNDRGPNGTNGPNRDVLAQQFGGGAMGGGSAGSVPIGSGPGGMGGGANADFDSLIDLIVSTVASETWAENGGGEAEIRPFPTNLSLVISQTQAVHEQIADLLEQLRRLQDLQVTIEVRFIRLNDSFFERIGIDFDANIGPAANANTVNANGTANKNAPSAIVGVTETASPFPALPAFTTDLDVPFRQQSFAPGDWRRSETRRRSPPSALPSSAKSRPTSSSKPPRATVGRTCSTRPK